MTTRQTVNGTGSPQNVVLEFDYINQSHVKVAIDGTPLAFSWVNPSTVQFTAPVGKPVLVYRDTPKANPLVQFGSTNSVGSLELNLVARQALFAAEEFRDVAANAVDVALSGKADLVHSHSAATTVAPGFMSAADKAKLDGVAAGATANASNAELRDRGTHTGTQPASSIADLPEAVQDIMGSSIIGGSNVTVTYNDLTGFVVINATGELAVNWDTITNRPSSFIPSAHVHSIADVSGLQAALDSKALGTHGHSISDVSGLSLALSGKVDVSGGLIGTTFFGGDGCIDINRNGSGDRPSYIDFHSYGGPVSIDYSARLIRTAGVDGVFGLYNSGAGPVTLVPGLNGYVIVGESGKGNFLYIARQDNVDEGGQIYLQRANTNTTLSSDIAVDTWRDLFRVFENGGSFRGITWNLAECPAGLGAVGIHSGNLRAQLANISAGEIGSYGFMRDTTGGTGPNGFVAGGSLIYASHLNPGVVAASGTWRCHGNTAGSGEISLFQRVA